VRLAVTINGRSVEAEVEPRMLLSDFLRHRLHLTGTHVGCEHGVCGACNILLDGEAVRSCLLFAVQVDGHDVRTVEGLEGSDDLQAAFLEERALQCGFCTPGFIVALAELGPELAGAPEARVRRALSGNLCRCTGYGGIVDAVRGQ
jgi:aerobic-type carbon monoxide dehydrogenase small subunit (CoxS/CutS family)